MGGMGGYKRFYKGGDIKQVHLCFGISNDELRWGLGPRGFEGQRSRENQGEGTRDGTSGIATTLGRTRHDTVRSSKIQSTTEQDASIHAFSS